MSVSALIGHVCMRQTASILDSRTRHFEHEHLPESPEPNIGSSYSQAIPTAFFFTANDIGDEINFILCSICSLLDARNHKLVQLPIAKIYPQVPTLFACHLLDNKYNKERLRNKKKLNVSSSRPPGT